MRRTMYLGLMVVLAFLAGFWLYGSGRVRRNPEFVQTTQDQRQVIHGLVTDASGPVEGARVKQKGKQKFVLTGDDGRFQLRIQNGFAGEIVASKCGYFIGGTVTNDSVTVELEPLPDDDNQEYEWVEPCPDPVRSENCGNCHQQIFDEWATGAHARSADGRRFMNLYDGTDWNENTDRGWNLLADYPEGSGVCNTCHAPSLRLNDLSFTDLRELTGVPAQGVHCDFCHKVQHVDTTQLGLTHGRDAMTILRPSHGQLFFGPLDDVNRGEDVFSPLQSDSRFCSSCHEGVVFGIHVYSTYSEWMLSSARRNGKQCQTCHMRPTGHMHNVAPDSGGIDRDPRTLASHELLPGGKLAMLKNCLEIEVQCHRTVANVKSRIDVLAHSVGHRVPTGYIDRHLVLVVEPMSVDGRRLPTETGPLLPLAAGDDWMGTAGRLFAKLLRDANGASPAPFWREVEVVMDTRLVPGETATSHFSFPAATQRVRVRLVYRRFWAQVAKMKNWPDNEIVIFDQFHEVPNSRHKD